METLTIGVIILLLAGAGGGGFVYYEDVKSADVEPDNILTEAPSIVKLKLDTEDAVRQICSYLEIEYTSKIEKCLEKIDIEVWGINGLTVASINSDYRTKFTKHGYELFDTATWDGCGFTASGFFAKGILHGRFVFTIEHDGDVECPFTYFQGYDVVLVTSSGWLNDYSFCMKALEGTNDFFPVL